MQSVISNVSRDVDPTNEQRQKDRVFRQYDRLRSPLDDNVRNRSLDVASTVTAARRVSKKYRSRREYMRLKAILPTVCNKKTVSKVFSE